MRFCGYSVEKKTMKYREKPGLCSGRYKWPIYLMGYCVSGVNIVYLFHGVVFEGKHLVEIQHRSLV